jgi:hypothetical protein
VREVSATCDSDSVAEDEGSLMFPEVLRQVTGEGINAGLVVTHVGKVLQGAPVGKDVEEAQELPVNPPRGRHDTRQKGVCGALPVGIRLAIPGHLGARSGLEELVDIVVAQLPVAAAHFVPRVLGRAGGVGSWSRAFHLLCLLPLINSLLMFSGWFWCRNAKEGVDGSISVLAPCVQWLKFLAVW